MTNFSLEALKISALSSANFRGHKMKPFEDLSETVATSDCEICGKGVAVNTKPAPNQIDIGGAAVAVGCDD